MVLCIYSLGVGQKVGDSTSSAAKRDTSHGSTKDGWLSVHSVPSGAEVYDGSRLIGVTPIDSLSAQVGIHVLRLFYPNVQFWNPVSSVDSFAVQSSRKNILLVRFDTAAGNGIRSGGTSLLENNPSVFLSSWTGGNSKAWVAYTAGATMILSGALSAFLKTNSDNDFEAYVANPDPNLLSRVHRLDTWAGISLFISEISFGVLTYLLLTEL
jgi:hypothetical protein